MKHTEFDFNGRTLRLSFTMDAMMQALERFGDDDILQACLAPTPDGWRDCCWLAALMAAQGELQRRHLGYEAEPMVTLEELRTGLMAGEGNALRQAVRDAVAQGLRREIRTPGDTGEINRVLAEREAEEKKKEMQDIALAFLRSLLSGSDTPPPTS